ncbi:MAG: acetate--CoA ligase family protein [Thermoguttaceae bacterium]|jgi:acetyltransferase|nr:acetate--CoA ligase family protein [Thermoguttaceae bacterium]
MTTTAPERVPTKAPHSLDALFSPRSVAVVGVTATPGTVPYDIFHNLLHAGFRGPVYPVAPGKRAISNVPAYRYLIDIDQPVDLAVIVFPADVVDRALEHCARKGVRAVVVISAGFREVGPEGQQREDRLKRLACAHGIALVGPNCLGVINTDPAVRLNASFARKMPHAGRIAFLSQSGALCTAVLDYAREKQIGFSKFVSFGNKAGVAESDLLEYLHHDEETDVILLYLEDLRDVRRLVAAAQRVTHEPPVKPILAIKAGRTPQGADAAASHTGSLAAEDDLCDAAFREAGILRVDSIDELFNTAILYAYQPLPAGDRLGIVTNAGGPGVMATDAAVREGLRVPRLAEETQANLRGVLPATAAVKNPVDVIGDARADRYEAALRQVLADPNVDQALVILTPQSMTDIEAIAQAVCRVHEAARDGRPAADLPRVAPKPVACSFMGATDVAEGIRVLQQAHIPHYILPEWACRAMAGVQAIRRMFEEPPDVARRLPVDDMAVRSVLDAAPAGYLAEHEALEVLEAYGLPVVPWRLCTTADEAVGWAEASGYPVTLRVVSRQVVHKSEIGAVALDLTTSEAVRVAFDALRDRVAAARPDAHIDGLLVRRMIPAGYELILGAKRDPIFGPVVMFGLGGIYVELFRDVVFALAPLGPRTARNMVRRAKAGRLVEGFRGGPRADIAGIEECLVRVGQLVSDFERLVELDINPLLASPAERGNAVADVRIRVA